MNPFETVASVAAPQTDSLTGLQMVERARSGRIFTVTFRKRTGAQEVREMTCRRGVRKGITGKGMAYDPIGRALLTVYDVQKKAYRMISLDRLISLKMGRREYRWTGRRFERVPSPVVQA